MRTGTHVVRRVAAVAAIMLGLGTLTAARADGSPLAASSCGDSGAVSTVSGTLADGATYKIQCPAGRWNGSLFLYSHGYVAFGPNPAQDGSDPVTDGWLLSQGYALAGSSYAGEGWAVHSALRDQIQTLDAFGSRYGTPVRTIAWGHSLGGMITAGLIQDNPGRFAGAVPFCGVLSGGVATWNIALDAEFAFQRLIDPAVSVVNITNPAANLGQALSAAGQAQLTAAGRARLALAAALGDTPGWVQPLQPAPARTDYLAQEQAQYTWDTAVTFPFVFAFRAQLEQKAGGNPSWNTGVNYAADLRKSADYAEVKALYRQAGLSLSGDLATLDRAPRVSADPAAVRYLTQNVTYTGKLSIPVLTVHTVGDGLVVPENEQAYRALVDRDGDGALLRQLFVNRAGHCEFSAAEQITAISLLLSRVRTGHWRVPGSAVLNRRAAALGAVANQISVSGSPVPAAPAFVHYRPRPYLRPYPEPGRRER